ncbi:NAD(P)/FAD-dependent oxidoreductase [Parvibaculum sp.]|uniref:phytoene desaturase family protein n=1 Tax=Parvibaculum sp. TaxID=2024848 RepID=UPI00320F5657
MERHDAIIIGGGLNGLTAAAYLARFGARVLVLERNAALGGADASYEIVPGFNIARYNLGISTLPARIVSELDLARYGLRFIRVDGGISLLKDGGYIASYRDGVIHRRELARHSLKDADGWTRFRRDMLRGAQQLRPLLATTMSDPTRRSFSTLRRLLSTASRWGARDVDELHELTRLWTLSCAEFLDAYFHSDAVKTRLAGDALAGTSLGPHAPTGARHLIGAFIDEMATASGGAPARVLASGGPAAVAGALRAAIEAHGGTIRTDAEVTDVLLREGAARGVVLANGEEIQARAVVSDLDLKRTFLALFPWSALPGGLVEKVGRFRMRGVSAKINIALDSAPEFPAVPAGCPALLGGVRLASSLDEMDRAADDWRDGIPPRVPLIDMLIPTLADPTLAPHGRHVLSVAVHYVPESLHDGAWTGERRDELTDLVVDRIAEASPGIKDRIVALEMLTPPDIESEVGVTGGDLSHGETTLDQSFFNRPSPALAGYETPIRNLYLCSQSVHPGPLGVGNAGANAAALVAAALGKRG